MRLLKVPFDKGSLNKNTGSKNAPDAIIEQLNTLINENGKYEELSIETINVLDQDIKQTQKNIYEHIQSTDLSEKTIMIGGDHSITYPAFTAFSQKYNNAGLIYFDAYPDCSKVLDVTSHEDVIINLIENNYLKPQNILMIGIRNWNKGEYDYLKSKKINIIHIDEILDDGMSETTEKILTFVKQFDGLYASIDINVVDPVFAPGTGTLEPAGLTSRQLIYFVHKIRLLKNLKMIDLVEVNPDKDINNLTVNLGAKIIKEFMN